ncbi:hypothetical protein BCR43DRAFT_523978, partial [Syncephalastrum racemosum]
MCTAFSQRVNSQRRINPMKGLARKNIAHKVDMLFKFFMQEYGCVECEISSDGTGTSKQILSFSSFGSLMLLSLIVL